MRKNPDFDNHPLPVQNVYRAVCCHVVDGDTYDFMIDLGFLTYSYVPIRLLGLDAPEKNTARGILARQRAEELLLNKQCKLITFKDKTTFGRFVAEVWYLEGTVWISIADQLRREGHVK